MNALEQLMKDAVALGKLDENYILSTRLVGQNLQRIIQIWPHYGPTREILKIEG